jgi:hypothetical protein
VARSGLGDGLVGFRQGPFGQAAIVVTQVSAPPAQFVISVPNTWVKPAAVQISWQPAVSAQGPLRYQVVLDGRGLATGAGAMQMRLNPHGLGDGRHRVQVLATDVDGEATLTPPATLKVDGRPPTIVVRRSGRGSSISVRIRDSASGVSAHYTSVSFGDGKRARGRGLFHHRYARGGVYQLVVRVRDKVGNQGVVRRWVSVQ